MEPLLETGEVNPEYIARMEQDDEFYFADTFFKSSTIIKQSIKCADAALAILRGDHKVMIAKDTALSGTLFHKKVLEPHTVANFLFDHREDIQTKNEIVKHVPGCDEKCRCQPTYIKTGKNAGKLGKNRTHYEGCTKKCDCPRRREIKKPFQNIDIMVQTLEEQKSACKELASALDGKAEKVLVGKVGGHWCKAKLDLHFFSADASRPGFINDLKTAGNFFSKYDAEVKSRVEWYDELNYVIQMAFYRALYIVVYGKPPEHVYITGVSKQDPPMLDFIDFQVDWNIEMNTVYGQLDMLEHFKENSEGAKRCGACAWCRKSQVIKQARTIR